MGGCRCSFRNCENSTQNNPSMHFFHFPFRDLPRCEKWAEYSNNLAFLQLPINQLRNKVVCETHFKDACFMNIKRERLTKFAIPTLLRTRNGEIVDFEINQTNPTIYDVQTTKTSKYYEPPSKPIKLLNNMPQSARHLKPEETVSTSLTDTTTFNYAEIVQDEVITNSIIEDDCVDIADSEPTLLNGITLKKVDVNHFDSETNLVASSVAKLTKRKLPPPIVKNKIRVDHVDIVTSVDNLTKSDFEDDFVSKRRKIAESISSNIGLVKSNVLDKTFFVDTIERQSKQIDGVKKSIIEKLEKMESHCKQSNNQSQMVGHEKPRYVVESGPAKTKIQLFNGIKKYLNPSMVSLLRMEMFGDTEREYKSDEKSLAVELLNVQSNIYEYMRSELRFRLPPKKDAECWAKEMSENGREIDWEDEL